MKAKEKTAQVPMEQSPLQEIEGAYEDLINASHAVTSLLQHIESRGKDPQLVDALLYATGALIEYLDIVDEWIGSGKPLHTQMEEITHDIVDVERTAYMLAAMAKLHDAGTLIAAD